MVRKLQELVQNGELTITKTALENIIKVIDDILENHQKDDYSEAYDRGHEDGFEEGYEQAVAEHKQ